MVALELSPALIEDGLKVAVTPGSFVSADSTTVPAAPTSVVLTEIVMLAPWTMPRLLGLAEIEKSQQTPNPWSGTDLDPPTTFPVNTREPKRSPPVAGVNVTNTWQNMPAASGLGALGQLMLEIAKSPVATIVPSTPPTPELNTVMFAADAGSTTSTLAKSLLS